MRWDNLTDGWAPSFQLEGGSRENECAARWHDQPGSVLPALGKGGQVAHTPKNPFSSFPNWDHKPSLWLSRKPPFLKDLKSL